MEKSNCYLLKAISKLRNCLHLLTKLLLVDIGNHLIWKLATILIVFTNLGNDTNTNTNVCPESSGGNHLIRKLIDECDDR